LLQLPLEAQLYFLAKSPAFFALPLTLKTNSPVVFYTSHLFYQPPVLK